MNEEDQLTVENATGEQASLPCCCLLPPSSINKKVGSRIRSRRAMLGLSQLQLAEFIGKGLEHLQKFERGVNAVGASCLYQIACSLSVSVSYFFEDISREPIQKRGFAPQNKSAERTNSAITDREVMHVAAAFNCIILGARRKTILDLVKSIST